MGLNARIKHISARLADVRGRRGRLRRALAYRHSRTLYWQARCGVKRSEYNVKKFRASRELGLELRHTLKVVTQRERNASSKLKRLRKLKAEKDLDMDGLAVFDGKTVAAWFVPILQEARSRGWRGYLVSGYRTPEYSEQLCYRICGRASCPGTCAGRATNHAKKGRGQGAIDVSDYYRFAQILKQMGAPIYNALPHDLVHFSSTGR